METMFAALTEMNRSRVVDCLFLLLLLSSQDKLVFFIPEVRQTKTIKEKIKR